MLFSEIGSHEQLFPCLYGVMVQACSPGHRSQLSCIGLQLLLIFFLNWVYFNNLNNKLNYVNP